jgi:DegV family protein with EDD domain
LKKNNLVQIRYLDGARYLYAVTAGCQEIIKHEEELNQINVFPIPDKDTGLNLKKTLMPIVISSPFHRPEIKHVSQEIADRAVQSAMGYSGIIFAEIFLGFAEGMKDFNKIRTQDLGTIATAAVKRAYGSLEKPVEGTLLTVLRSWSEEVGRLCMTTEDFVPLFKQARQKALIELHNTPHKLEVLKKNKVVDAGGKAWVLFLDGILNFIEEGVLKKALRPKKSSMDVISKKKQIAPYCAECCIRADKLDRLGLIKKLNEIGQDLIFYGSFHFAKIHLNTDHPERAFSQISAFGEISAKKIFEFSANSKSQAEAPICLISDSTCDLSDDIVEKNPVYFVPIKVHADDKTYTEGWDIVPEEFYQIMDSSATLPKTSQPSLMDFSHIYSHLLSHYSSILSVQISKGLSGTYQTAVQAAQSFPPKRITVLDGKNISVGLGLVLIEGIKAMDQGMDLEKTMNRLQRAIDDTKIYIGIPTLKYLVKGGRIPRTKGLIAEMLNINPVLSLSAQGKLEPVTKAWGKKRLEKKIIDLAIQKIQQRGAAFSVAVAHTNAPHIGNRLAQKVEDGLRQKVEMILNASPALGAHAGPGAFGIAVCGGGESPDSQSDITLKT